MSGITIFILAILAFWVLSFLSTNPTKRKNITEEGMQTGSYRYMLDKCADLDTGKFSVDPTRLSCHHGNCKQYISFTQLQSAVLIELSKPRDENRPIQVFCKEHSEQRIQVIKDGMPEQDFSQLAVDATKLYKAIYHGL